MKVNLYPLGVGLFRWFFRLFYRIEVQGSHPNEHPGAAIFAPNHASLLDPPLVGAMWREDVHYLAKKALFSMPILGWFMHRVNAHPVSRGGGDIASIRTITRLLDTGKKVVIFPEGTRTTTGEMMELKGGVALIALKAKCPVIPVYIHGTYKAWGPHQRFPRLGKKLICIFGEPIPYEEFAGEDTRTGKRLLTERLTEEIGKLKESYLAHN